jgi:cell wall-associated NlpC family hydrolase
MSRFESFSHQEDSTDAKYKMYKKPVEPFKSNFSLEKFNLDGRDYLARNSPGWKKNPQVALVQASLVKAGFNVGAHGIDGIIGKDTRGAIQKFKAAMGLEATGDLDAETRWALESVIRDGLNDQKIRVRMGKAGVEHTKGTELKNKEKESKTDVKNENVHKNWKDVALALVGKPYQFDSVKKIYPNPPKTFDCSSLAQWVYKYGFGVDLPRTVAGQYGATKAIDQSVPGCLVIFNGTYDINKDSHLNEKDKYTHVGIWLGNNQFLQASSSQGVTVSMFNSYYQRIFDSFRVVPEVNY